MGQEASPKEKTTGILYPIFVGLTIFGAFGLFLFELLHGRTGVATEAPVLPIFVLSTLSIIAAGMSVEFSPAIVVSVVNLPTLLAVIFTGPVGGGIVAMCGAFWTARKWRGPSIAIIFSGAVALIEAMVSAEFFLLLQSRYNFSVEVVSVELLVTAAIAGIILLLVNLVLITLLSFVKYPGTVKQVWKQNFLPALPSQLFLVGVGLVILAIYVKGGLVAATLFFIPIFASQHVFKLLVQQKELLAEQTKMSQDLMDMNIGLAGALIMLLDSKDHYTASHSAGVAMYCRDMARIMGLTEDEQRIAHMAGLLHDLGKVGTPDAVLKKEGELTPREWELIKEHPTTAAEVLSQLATHKEIADIIRHHQEHFDGSGYPYGLKGEDIPELSRMLAVADTYHALTSNRPYREAKSPFEALIILRRVAGTQLDLKYVEIMAQVLKNEDLSYREGSKADFLTEFRKGRPTLKLYALKKYSEKNRAQPR